MIGMLISLVVLAIVVAIVIWILGYLGLPDIIQKVVIALAVLIALVLILDGFGVWTGPWHTRDTPVIIERR